MLQIQLASVAARGIQQSEYAILGLWIGEVNETDGALTLRLAGQLSECEVDRLAARLHEYDTRKLRLDLEGLTFVGARGVELLRSARRAGTALLRCPPVIFELVDCS